VQYHFDDFLGCLNQPFTLDLNGSTYPLELISVDRLVDSATVGERVAFSIVFRGDSEINLEQQIYRISQDTLGDMDLFIVPIGPDDKGMRYEAVFT
jgi:hypothetical protein